MCDCESRTISIDGRIRFAGTDLLDVDGTDTGTSGARCVCIFIGISLVDEPLAMAIPEEGGAIVMDVCNRFAGTLLAQVALGASGGRIREPGALPALEEEAIVTERAERPAGAGGPLALQGHTCRIASIKLDASETFWKFT